MPTNVSTSNLLTLLDRQDKLDMVDWICGNNHVVKGVAEGKACGMCNEKFDEWLDIFLTAQLSQLHRAFEEGTAAMICERQEHPPATVENSVFLKALFTSHGIQGQGMKYPDHVSTLRKCNV